MHGVLGAEFERDRPRLLVVFAPDAEDARLGMQRGTLADRAAEAAERDLVVVEALGDGTGVVGEAPLPEGAAAELRLRTGVSASAFAALLIGGDGGEKKRWDGPVSADWVFTAIDALPMRRAELQARGDG